jgi:amino acid transporter
VPTTYADDDLADGRAALLSGWSTGSEPGLVITRAAGALVWDSKGNEYIDCTSMAWSNNIGASVPEVIEAAFAQARQLSHLRSNFDSIPLLLLSKAMTHSAPGDLTRRGLLDPGVDPADVGGALWYGFVLAALLPLYCFIGWEGAADLAEETNDPRSVTPFAMIRAAAVGIGINLLSAGIAANVVSITSVAYYFIYLLTVGGAIYAYRKGNIPAHRPGDFSLGRWFVPVTVIAFAYAGGVIVIALAPHEGHTAALYLLGAEVAGALWYLLYLRRRITRQSAGVLRQEVVELEKSAEASSVR